MTRDRENSLPAAGPSVYAALLHYPVYNKRMEIVSTSVTNIDLHDLSRCTATYAVKRLFVVHPLPVQRRLVEEIIRFWQEGYGSASNPDRRDAFSLVSATDTLTSVVNWIEAEEGQKPRLVTTDARQYPNSISFARLRQLFQEEKGVPYLLLFGTGWGLAAEVMTAADYILEPVAGVSGYNHLSVRAAVAIILDRLLGEKWWS